MGKHYSFWSSTTISLGDEQEQEAKKWNEGMVECHLDLCRRGKKKLGKS